MAVLITIKQRTSLSVHPVDAAGNPAKLSGVKWTSGNPAIVEVIPSPDGLSAWANAVSIGGPVTITATDGTLSATTQITVVSTDAVDFTIVDTVSGYKINSATPSPK